MDQLEYVVWVYFTVSFTLLFITVYYQRYYILYFIHDIISRVTQKFTHILLPFVENTMETKLIFGRWVL